MPISHPSTCFFFILVDTFLTIDPEYSRPSATGPECPPPETLSERSASIVKVTSPAFIASAMVDDAPGTATAGRTGEEPVGGGAHECWHQVWRPVPFIPAGEVPARWPRDGRRLATTRQAAAGLAVRDAGRPAAAR